ncbi:LysE family transporter [Mesonia aquimarina]|uniref:LysE family transporter n=1 Tax=Mesonia aquimarina TaxID=1504967 RepID=UPI000EF56E49|nr:LysE family transporter [Mesonia aquimarina]
MEEAQLFFFTFFAALLGVLPPGLVNMTVAKTCVQKGKSNGILVALGASLIVFCQACIAILMAKYIFNHPFVRNMLLRAGLVVFVILAIYFFIMARKKKVKKTKVSKHNSAKSFFTGITIALLNVFPIPYFVVISTAFNAKGGYNYSALSVAVFALAAALGTFTSLYVYVISFLKIEKHTGHFSKYSNYFMAVLMLILVVITLIRIYCY